METVPKSDYESLKRLHESANAAILSLEHGLSEERKQRILSMNINSSLEQQLNILKGINREAITGHNAKEQEYIAEIQMLRGQIKELRTS